MGLHLRPAHGGGPAAQRGGSAPLRAERDPFGEDLPRHPQLRLRLAPALPAGTAHEVWFEDARSMSAKLRLIARRGLRGAGYWNLMRPYPQGWTVLNALYDVL